MNRAAAEALIRAELPRKAEELCRLLRESASVKARTAVDSTIPVGQSKFGGWPDVDTEFNWPCVDGRPLAFLLQLNCRDIRLVAPDLPVPPQGVISVFYDIENQPWGFDPKDGQSKCVRFIRSIESLRRCPPNNAPSPLVVPSAKISLDAALDFPGAWEEPALEGLDLSEQEFDKIDELRNRIAGSGEGGHQLFGYPWIIQNSMQEECQLASSGVFVGEPEGYESEAGKNLLTGASDWLVWLQVDSDDKLKLMWGDVGRIYFWIRKQDLAASRFDRSWLILQCT